MTIKIKHTSFLIGKAILLLFALFGNNIKVRNNKVNNSNIYSLSNLSLKLLANIMSYNQLNLLLKSNDYKL